MHNLARSIRCPESTYLILGRRHSPHQKAHKFRMLNFMSLLEWRLEKQYWIGRTRWMKLRKTRVVDISPQRQATLSGRKSTNYQGYLTNRNTGIKKMSELGCISLHKITRITMNMSRSRVRPKDHQRLILLPLTSLMKTTHWPRNLTICSKMTTNKMSNRNTRSKKPTKLSMSRSMLRTSIKKETTSMRWNSIGSSKRIRRTRRRRVHTSSQTQRAKGKYRLSSQLDLSRMTRSTRGCWQHWRRARLCWNTSTSSKRRRIMISDVQANFLSFYMASVNYRRSYSVSATKSIVLLAKIKEKLLPSSDDSPFLTYFLKLRDVLPILSSWNSLIGSVCGSSLSWSLHAKCLQSMLKLANTVSILELFMQYFSNHFPSVRTLMCLVNSSANTSLSGTTNVTLFFYWLTDGSTFRMVFGVSVFGLSCFCLSVTSSLLFFILACFSLAISKNVLKSYSRFMMPNSKMTYTINDS